MYLEQVKSAGLKVFLWTVNDPKDALEWRDKVDGIVTDNVEEIIKALNRQK